MVFKRWRKEDEKEDAKQIQNEVQQSVVQGDGCVQPVRVTNQTNIPIATQSK